MNNSQGLRTSTIQDVESWNDTILSFPLDDMDPTSFDRQIERSLAAALDPGKAFIDIESSCEVLHCTSYWPVQ